MSDVLADRVIEFVRGRSGPRTADENSPASRTSPWPDVLPPHGSRPIPGTAVLPTRDGDPAPASPHLPTEADHPSDILRCAELLGIPWKRILLADIEAEQKLRRYISDVDDDFSLPAVMTVLSFSFLRSWRVRDCVESLSCQARGASVRGAARQLGMVFQRLLGKADRDQAAFAQHLWFAYQRVLLLQRACHAASRSQGADSERLAFVCARARCSYDDAAWALSRLDETVRRGHRLEASVQKVREEGFLIPRAESEARAFEQLRRIVRSSPHLTGKRPSRRKHLPPVGRPGRVALPVGG